jgi:hypothetical protein
LNIGDWHGMAIMQGGNMRRIVREDYQLDGTCHGNVLITTISGTGTHKSSLDAALYMARQIKDNGLTWGMLKIMSPEGRATLAGRYQTAYDVSTILRRRTQGGILLVPDQYLTGAKFFAAVCTNFGLRVKAFPLTSEDEILAELVSGDGPLKQYLNAGRAVAARGKIAARNGAC